MAITQLVNLKATPQFFVAAKPLAEPLDAAEALERKMERFPEEIYTHSRGSHLFRYLLALCGDAGAGALKKQLLYTRLEQMLESTHHGDLDKMYGGPLHLPRLSEELYEVNPHAESLTEAQWQEVKTRDARYRARALTWMRAIIHGPSIKGISLAGEAAIDVECDVFERWRYLENQASDDPVTVTDIGETGTMLEFVIIPRTHSITQEERRRVLHLIEQLQPVNSICTIYDGHEIRTERAVMDIEASSDSWNVLRYVKGQAEIDWPEPNPEEGFWIVPEEEIEAPTFAWVNAQESATYLTIDGVETSSHHIGPFNPIQKELFSHLETIPDPWYQFYADRAYARNFAPINFTVPWVNREE